MSVRLKVFLIITAIVLVISASSVLISISAAQNQIIKTLEGDMQRVVTGANLYMHNLMEQVKMDASAVAQALTGRPVYEMQLSILPEQVAAYDDFLAIAVYNSQGRIDASYSMGAEPPPESMVLGDAGQLAFHGERIITTSNEDSSGQLVFYIFVPLDFQPTPRQTAASISSQIVGFTLPGDYFNKQLIQFQSENPGRIIMLDNRGKIIADVFHDEWVTGQMNFLEEAREDKKYADVARAVRRVLSGSGDVNQNVDRYVIKDFDGRGNNIEDIIAFRYMATLEGWSIVASSSVAESPFGTVWLMISLSGLIFFGLGILSAALASGIIAKPFEVAQALTRAKTAFIANMSHDLRTPLNAVIGFSDLNLTKKGLPPDVKSNLKKTEENGMTILEVVNDLLDISNIESGKFGVISAEYDLPNFILDTAESNLTHINAKPIVFSIAADEKLPARLNGDALRVRQIFNNLLSNAFRHTKEGTVEWKISTEKNGDSVWLVSSVSDSNTSIRQEDAEKLFLDYSSLDTQKMRSSQGTGLGLPLTKKIVDLMQGTITVTCNEGKGSVFTIRLPQKHVNDEVISTELAEKLKRFKSIVQKPIDISEIQRVSLPNAKVLVVDDVDVNLEVAKGMIESYGIKVDCVLSTVEAVELVRSGQPQYNAIFMNRWMPEMDGTQAVRAIRNEIGTPYAKNVPIIAITANTVIGNNAFFLKAGFQDVISKPLDILRLDKAIRKWVAGEEV